MKNLYFCLLILLATALHPAFAQAPDGLRTQLNQIFANVDKSQVPSAYLDEYAEQLLGLHPYNGVLTDSNSTDLDVFRYLRATISSARVAGTDTLPSLPELNRRLNARRQGVSGAPNPIAVQYMTYHRISPNALKDNLLTVQDNLVYDVAGRPSSPYYAATLFAAAPLYTISRTGAASFVFARNLYLTNNPLMRVVGLALDFDDGRGYVAASWNQAVSTTYTSTGHKHIRVKVTCRKSPFAPATFSLESHFDLEVVQLATTAARYASADDITKDFTSPTGAHDGATVSVRYGRGHTGMTKPFIMVEQYNLAAILEKLAPDLIPCDNGNNTIVSFLDKINKIDFDGGRGNFNDALHNLGQYDLVYIDFKHNTDDIRRNAVLFQEVVRWVNDLKAQNGSPEQNVIMGQSMGGLISRYGLAQMVRNRENPQVRLLVLHDSPQRGAYSPVGTQSLARALDVPGILGLAVTDFSNTAKATVTILNEPASQQLSILNAYDPRGDIRPDPFLNGQYRQIIDFSPSDPVQPTYDIVATSDGSQCGQPQNTPVGATLSTTSGDFFLRPLSYLPPPLSILGNFNVKADGAAFGLPAYGQQAQVSRLRIYLQYNLCIGYGPFKACIPLVDINFINESATSPPNTLPYETLPGGTTNPHDNAACSPGFDYYVPFLFRAFLQTSLYDGNLCFVPSYSALDVQNVAPSTAYAKYINSTTDNPSPPRVLRYVAQEKITAGSSPLFNLPHLRFTARNSEWIYNEMQRPFNGNTNPLTCEANPECAPFTATISGPDAFCLNSSATNQYTITNLPAGVSVAWSATTTAGTVSPASYTGSTYSLSANSATAGTVTVQAVLSSATCTLATLQLSVALGSKLNYTINTSSCAPTITVIAPGYLNVTLTVNGDQVSVGNGTQYRATWQNRQLDVNLTGTDKCTGQSLTRARTYTEARGQYCAERVAQGSQAEPTTTTPTAYPNPADDFVDIALPTAADGPGLEVVRLYDSYGRLRLEQAGHGARALRLRVARVPAGFYVLHLVATDGSVSRQRLQIAH